MKEYPSIPGASSHYVTKGLPCISQKKYDGSNLRFEWSKKKGWHLFGTRARLFNKTDPEFGCAIDIFSQKYASGIESVIRKDKHFRQCQEVICFCEYFGPYSFAGQHDPKHPAVIMGGCQGNNPKDLMLFDVSVHKKGFLSPRQFVNTFEGIVPIAEVVYEGNMNASFIEDVRNGKYPVVEGVICKGLNGKAPHGIWRAKIKTLAYLEELKKRFSNNWETLWE